MARLLFRDDPYLKSCEATVVVELDQTIFYPLGGGQAGDTGTLNGLKVVDTRKGDGDAVLHLLESPGLKPGDKVTAELNWERRHRLMRYHTALHLLGSVVQAP